MDKFKNSVGLVETKYFVFADKEDKLILASGQKLGPVTLAYETYGKLNSDKSNAILVVHALSGGAHAAGYNSENDKKPGWWENMIGPGKALDTDKYFIISSNILGSCYGSSGPTEINPETGKPYGINFPIVTVRDMVEAQRHLVDYFGIDKLLTVIGGSLGGMQVLQWLISYNDRIRSIIPIATSSKLSPQAIAFDEVGRQSIMSDPNWNRGDYYDGTQPKTGLSIARMIGHITYLSDEIMQEKFGRRRREGRFTFNPDFEVETYLHYQGSVFVERFDANSYIYISKAMDYFDLEEEILEVGKGKDYSGNKVLILSFSSDWLFPTYQGKEIVKKLMALGCKVSFSEIISSHGHDSFLVDVEQQSLMVKYFLQGLE